MKFWIHLEGGQCTIDCYFGAQREEKLLFSISMGTMQSSKDDDDPKIEATTRDRSSLEDTLLNLPKLLRERERLLDQRERELDRARKELEKENPTFGKPSDVLSLNVGGARIDVLRSTLTLIEGSMLASRFSGRWDDSIVKDPDGKFFIDQPRELFQPLVNYLRALSCETALASCAKSPVFNEKDTQQDFYRMIDYYGITLGVYPVGFFRIQSPASNPPVLVQSGPLYSVDSENWCTYCLLPYRGNKDVRYPRSFEVVLDKHSTAQIGWMDWCQHASTCFETVLASGGKGVGYTSNYSVAIDCQASTIACEQTLYPLHDLHFQEGTLIRCENKGQKWYVNTKLVASVTTEDGVVTIPLALAKYTTPVPCITFKGNIEITNIELDF